MTIPKHVQDKKLLLVDRAKFRSLLPDSKAADQEVDDALATINQTTEYNAERTKWTVEEWDRTAPINGASADRMLQGIPDGNRVYLLKDAATGRVVVFQPHQPGVQGWQKITDALAEGTVHADELAADHAAIRVAKLVQQRITAAG